MQEIIRLALSYLTGAWRYRWMMVILPALISPVGWFYVATLPDVYAASARVYVDTDTVLQPLMQGIAVRLDDNRRINMMTRLLFTPEIMEKLARMTDQDLRAKTPEDMTKITNWLKEGVSLKTKGSNIYDLGFENESPDLAKRVVQAFLTIFVVTNLCERRKDQDSAEQFLLRELKDYERRMLEVETKLMSFKTRNLGHATESGNYLSDLNDSKAKLMQSRLDLNMARERRNELEDQLMDFESGLESVAANPMQERISAIEQQIDDLLLRYTERHPEVISLRKELERLTRLGRDSMEQRAMELDDGESFSDPDQEFASNPIYQQLKMLFSESEADVASKQANVAEYERRVQELGTQVDKVLAAEAEQNQLTREQALLSGKHRSLMERLESLRLGRQVDTSADTVRFRVIEPPKSTPKPVGPNRILLSSSVFLGSLVGGIALAFLISLLRPSFSDRKMLAAVSGVTVLGSVGMLWTDAQTRRRRIFNVAFAVSFFGLLLLYGLVIAVYKFEVDVLSRLPVL